VQIENVSPTDEWRLDYTDAAGNPEHQTGIGTQTLSLPRPLDIQLRSISNTTTGCVADLDSRIVTTGGGITVALVPPSGTLCLGLATTVGVRIDGIAAGQAWTLNFTLNGENRLLQGVGTGQAITQNFAYIPLTTNTTISAQSITSGGCTTAITENLTLTALAFPRIGSNLRGDTTVCALPDLTFTLTDSTQSGASIRWAMNGTALPQTGNSLRMQQAGNYSATVSHPCTSLTYSYTIYQNTFKVAVRAVPDAITAGDETTLSAAVEPEPNAIPNSTYQYSWADSNGAVGSSPRISTRPTTTTNYTVTVTDNSGCSAQASVTVRVLDPTLTIPNVFTPNGDGINDRFEIRTSTEYFETAEIFIYDRWGNAVWQTEQAFVFLWRGTDTADNAVPTGTYIYVLNLKRTDGKTETRTGTITLIR
jgi:gliding motility-associated-like protein